MTPFRPPTAERRNLDLSILIYAVLAGGVCSLIYAVIIATTVSYFEGDPTTVYPVFLALFMATVGLGARTSTAVKGRYLEWFVTADLALAAVGGLSVPMLYLVFAETDFFMAAAVMMTLLIGGTVGFKLPILISLLDAYGERTQTIARAVTFDRLGVVVAFLAFATVLLPYYGILASSVLIGLGNLSIAAAVSWRFRSKLGAARVPFSLAGSLTGALLLAIFIGSGTILDIWKQSTFEGRVLLTEQTERGFIVMNSFRGDVRLYVNDELQFSSVDAHRYNEAIVHVPPLLTSRRIENVLVLGDDDGMVVQELLRRDGVTSVTQVSPNDTVSRLAKTHPRLLEINGQSLLDPRVQTVSTEIFDILESRSRLYDMVIADLPNPGTLQAARLYTRDFYELVRLNLAPGGVFVTQATSPYFAERAFRAIGKTMDTVFPDTAAYHLWVPSLGDWGFVVGGTKPLATDVPAEGRLPDTRFLTTRMVPGLFVFPPGPPAPEPVEIATLDRPIVLDYYLDGWRSWLN